jgi:hypothetical protein
MKMRGMIRGIRREMMEEVEVEGGSAGDRVGSSACTEGKKGVNLISEGLTKIGRKRTMKIANMD